jgi:predicted ATPase
MKIVITGGPSCGKTTLIKAMEEKGYRVMHELAREIIKELKLEKKINKSNVMQLQEEHFKRQTANEKEFDKSNEVIFLDRGILDGHAYCTFYFGAVPERFMKPEVRRYDLVFVLDPLPYIDDDVRSETHEQAMKIHDLLIKVYEEYGYEVIRVPDFGIEKRVEFVLDKVNKLLHQKKIRNN